MIRLWKNSSSFIVLSVTNPSWHSKWCIFQSKTKDDQIANKIIQKQD